MAERASHVVYGAGPLGVHVARVASGAGHDVRVATRSGTAAPGGTRAVRSDAADPASVIEACAGAEVIYNCAQPPYDEWPKLFPKIQAGLIEGSARLGAKLVAAENLYMYGPVSGRIHEGLPYAASTRKGAVRAAMAEQLNQAHDAGRVRTAAGRASDFFGPGVESSFMGAPVFRRAARGRPVYLLGDPDRLHTYTFVGDFARALLALGENAAADGRAWHVPSSPTVTTRAFVESIAREAGTAPRMRRIPSLAVRLGGRFNGLAREASEMLYEFESDFVVDHSRYAEAFGAVPVPHDRAIRATLRGPLPVTSGGLAPL